MVFTDFSVMSDDCWGGELYRLLGVSGRSPMMGLGMIGDDYLNFIKNLHKADAATFQPQLYYKSYPVVATPYGKIHFLHYPSRATAERFFLSRYDSINWDRVIYKIDLEKPWYTARHIHMWNEMQLPNSIALYSSRTLKIWNGPIHNGMYCPKYDVDGSVMFNISCRYFNVFHWIRTGEIKSQLPYRLLNLLLLDPTTFHRIRKKIRQAIG